MSDRLAKSFDKFLVKAVGNDTVMRRRLMHRGWKDFVGSDHPDTESPTEMAAAAIMYLGVNNRCWTDEPVLIVAILAFLKEHMRCDPCVGLNVLASALKKYPVDEEGVRKWFREAFDAPF